MGDRRNEKNTEEVRGSEWKIYEVSEIVRDWDLNIKNKQYEDRGREKKKEVEEREWVMRKYKENLYLSL